MSKEIQIRLNGEEKSVRPETSLAELLEILELDSTHVAIEVNREIIRKPQWEQFTLREGDSVEIVHFVGGGTR